MKKYLLSLLALAALFVGTAVTHPFMVRGATNEVPSTVAFFEDSLASSITSSATSFELVRGTDIAGNSLASSTYGFVIDEGTSAQEMVLADCNGTTCTNVTRGIDPVSGTSTVATLKKSHRRGASVKITDGPIVLILQRLTNGIHAFPSLLKYKSTITSGSFTDSQQIVSKGYVDSVAFSGAGVVDATESAKGVVELATQTEMASSTAAGSVGNLVIQAQYATSVAPTSGKYVPVTGIDGNIDDDFLPSTIAQATTFSSTLAAGTTTINGSLTLSGGSATSNIASSSIQAFTASTTPTTTWTKPSNLKYVLVKVVGGGGGGGGGTTDSESSGGGGGGGYCEKIIPASALGTTETVTVGGAGTGGAGGGAGSGATGNAGGPSSFGSHCSATGGGGGIGAGNGNTAYGGDGGIGSNGTINLQGGDGDSGITMTGLTVYAARGGDSHMGGGGGGQGVGGVYGGGGSGLQIANNNTGAAGAVGAVFVYQYFY